MVGEVESERRPGARAWTVLGLILAGALALRLATLSRWWSIYNDYDEGAWAAGARLIADGAVPYRDFLLVHPPLYEYVLAVVFLVTGFDFLVGRYVAVAFSMATIPLAWLIARRHFGERAGLWAAFAFGASPILVFAGRRIVPDAFAVFLAVLAIGLALEHLRAPRRRSAALLGAVLGALALTKFTHLMTVAAIAGALLLAMQPASVWRRIGAALAPRVLAATALLALGAYVALFALTESFDLDVKVPLLDDFFLTAPDLALLGTLVVLPYALARWLVANPADKATGVRFRFPWRHMGFAAAGFVVAALASVGPALFVAPDRFVEQTFLLQSNRPGVIAPSLLQFVRYFVGQFEPSSFYQAEVLLVFPFAWLLLRRLPVSRAARFLASGGLLAVAFAQPLGSFPRYYISAYPFLMLMVGAVFATARIEQPVRDLRPVGAVALACGMVALSIHVPFEYWGYDIANTITSPLERDLNDETLAFLGTLGASRIAATSPTLVLLDPALPAAASFDTFGYLWLLNESPSEVLNRSIAEGVDIMVITPWSHLWGGEYGEKSRALNEEIRARGTLLKVIGRDPVYHMEIYHLSGGVGRRIFNPSLDLLENTSLGETPLGWRRIEFNNDLSATNLTRVTEGGRAFTRFSVHQSGIPGAGDWSHVGVVQDVAFEDLTLTARVRTTAMTTEANETHIESGVQFRDEAGNWLIVGFGGGVGVQRFDREADNWSLTVLPVTSGEWTEHNFDVTALWADRGWPAPSRVNVEVFAAAHWRRPGDYSFDVEFIG